MKTFTAVSVLAMALSAVAAPNVVARTGGGDGGSPSGGSSTCNNNSKQVCCNTVGKRAPIGERGLVDSLSLLLGVQCLVQALGSGCGGSTYCCEGGDDTGSFSLIEVHADCSQILS